MALRFTPTLAVCLIGAGITGALLALPASDSNGAPATVAPAVEIADFSFSDRGYGNSSAEAVPRGALAPNERCSG